MTKPTDHPELLLTARVLAEGRHIPHGLRALADVLEECAAQGMEVPGDLELTELQVLDLGVERMPANPQGRAQALYARDDLPDDGGVLLVVIGGPDLMALSAMCRQLATGQEQADLALHDEALGAGHAYIAEYSERYAED